MQPKHVKEAFRLLNKSIIRVETPDVNLEQDEEMEEEQEQQDGGGGHRFFKPLGVFVSVHALQKSL